MLTNEARKTVIANLAVAIVCLLIMLGIAWWMLMEASREDSPWGDVPHCTHEIANAGGICHGEPR